MKKIKTLLILFVVTTVIIVVACKKNPPSCYDDALYQKHKNDVCPNDCPGITGCDEKFYCNECEANKVGIKKK